RDAHRQGRVLAGVGAGVPGGSPGHHVARDVGREGRTRSGPGGGRPGRRRPRVLGPGGSYFGPSSRRRGGCTVTGSRTDLRGVSDIRSFFRTNETPVYFVSATAFN